MKNLLRFRNIVTTIFEFIISKRVLFFFLSNLLLISVILFISNYFNVYDHSSKIGFSADSFSSSSITDGSFYLDSLRYYLSGDFLFRTNKEVIAGPVIPFLISLSFGKLYLLFLIYAILSSFSLVLWDLIYNQIFSQKISFFISSIILFNPFNIYFVLRPGSEVPFCLIFSVFIYSSLKLFNLFKSHLNVNVSEIKLFLILHSFSSILLVLTRPNGMLTCYLTSFVFLLFSFTNYSKTYSLGFLLRFLFAFLFVINTYMSFGYINYALEGFEHILTDQSYVYYFGVRESELIKSISNYPLLFKIPLTILWKISNWILSLSGIRDSFSNLYSYSGISAPVWQVILRISNGLFIFLPSFLLTLVYFLKSLLFNYKRLFNFTFYTTISSILVLLPNILLYNHERYFYMVFPAFLISSFSILCNNNNADTFVNHDF